MNIEVLDEQLLKSCWLSCSMPLDDLICVSGLIFRLDVLIIGVINNPM